MGVPTSIITALALIVTGSGRLARATSCDPAGADAPAIVAARADVAAHCDCSGSTSHKACVSCSAGSGNSNNGNGGGVHALRLP